MQHFVVIAAILVAALFIGWRLWCIWRHPDTTSCGCGCSGCGSPDRCPDPNGRQSADKP